MGFYGILMGIVLFLFLITIHELGHFTGAKLSGIKVNEFSVGMGPSVLKKQKGETLYSFRMLPIGGYVMMEGEETGSDDPRSYNNSKAWKRFLTILAGPLVNIIFAFIVFFIVASIAGFAGTEIDTVVEDSPAFHAGLQEGDRILEINNKKVNIFSEVSFEISNSDNNIDLLVDRDGQELEFTIEPENTENGKLIGIQAGITNNLLANLKYAFYNTIFLMKQLWFSIKGLVTGLFSVDQLSGPIGVIGMVSESASYGFLSFLNFGAFISLNLGFFNLLPIPALDGSKLIFILIEMITGKPVNPKVEQYLTLAGFIFLMGLIVFVSFKDITRLL